jgi:hypothetical protein
LHGFFSISDVNETVLPSFVKDTTLKENFWLKVGLDKWWVVGLPTRHRALTKTYWTFRINPKSLAGVRIPI